MYYIFNIHEYIWITMLLCVTITDITDTHIYRYYVKINIDKHTELVVSHDSGCDVN